MSTETLKGVLARLSEQLGHIPYAVSGLAAMAVYGIAGRRPRHVSVVCAEHSRDNMLSWARAKGLEVSGDDSIWIAGSAEGASGTPRRRRVRIRCLSGAGFDALARVPIAQTGGHVLALPELMELAATAWLATSGAAAAEEEDNWRLEVALWDIANCA